MSTSTTELTVGDVLMTPDRIPVVTDKTLIKVVLEEMTKFRLGIACVIGDNNRFLGIFTDGDVRRMLLRDQRPFSALFADDVINHVVREPATTTADNGLGAAIKLMEEKGIWDLPVVDSKGCLTGLLHLHPAIKALLEI